MCVCVCVTALCVCVCVYIYSQYILLYDEVGCVSDLEYGLPVQVRDNALNVKDDMPKSDVGREYYLQNMDQQVHMYVDGQLTNMTSTHIHCTCSTCIVLDWLLLELYSCIAIGTEYLGTEYLMYKIFCPNNNTCIHDLVPNKLLNSAHILYIYSGTPI